MTIWKFPLDVIDEQTISLPLDSKILHVGLDPRGELCIWAMVHPAGIKYSCSVKIVGTGHVTAARVEDHIGTVTMGNFVWHVFARPQ